MFLGRILRLLLEPARDPLYDSLAGSMERVAALRARLDRQTDALRARTARLNDPTLRAQLERLDVEQEHLRRVEQRLASELDACRARRDLVAAHHTAVEAQNLLAGLVQALDAAQAHAAALADLSATISEDMLCPPPSIRTH
jgi:predicted  nucleic acid-binding Zn-ribbon protein